MIKNNTKIGIEAIKVLLSSKPQILRYLKQAVRSGDFDYRTFGTAIEKHLSDAIINIFKKSGFIEGKGDYKTAPHKNYFPDFELKIIPPIAIEFKSGNRKQNRRGR